MRNIIIITLALLLQFSTLSAQNTSSREEFIKSQNEAFAQYKASVQRDYESFLEKRNAEYAAFIAARWQQYQVFQGIEPPLKPYPKEPAVKTDKQLVVGASSMPIKSVKKIPTAKAIAQEFQMISQQEIEEIEEQIRLANSGATSTLDANSPKGYQFNFMGNVISVGITNDHLFTLAGVNESEISKRWTSLSDGSFNQVVEDCIYWKERLSLNDYLYVLMLDYMCNSLFDATHQNEARLMKTYILSQSGYDAKCARCSTGLVMLLSFEESIYQKQYLMIGGNKYYIIDEPEDSDKEYYTYSQKFADQSKSCSVRIEKEFTINRNVTQAKRLASKLYPSLEVNTVVDKNLIDIYNNYPRCSWDVYAKAPMSSLLSDRIIPTLQREIEGKEEIEAANMILNFVQTAFSYKTDDDYFGYERTLFVDELFYYPYSDCEDRAILFANLTKRLLGVDVVLLHYTDHLATAVKFNENFNGDYVTIGSSKYIVCDPTYIGAEVGNAMPEYKNVSVEVVML